MNQCILGEIFGYEEIVNEVKRLSKAVVVKDSLLICVNKDDFIKMLDPNEIIMFKYLINEQEEKFLGQQQKVHKDLQEAKQNLQCRIDICKQIVEQSSEQDRSSHEEKIKRWKQKARRQYNSSLTAMEFNQIKKDEVQINNLLYPNNKNLYFSQNRG